MLSKAIRGGRGLPELPETGHLQTHSPVRNPENHATHIASQLRRDEEVPHLPQIYFPQSNDQTMRSQA